MPNVIVVLEYVERDVDLFPIIALTDYRELFRLKEQLSAIQVLKKQTCFWITLPVLGRLICSTHYFNHNHNSKQFLTAS